LKIKLINHLSISLNRNLKRQLYDLQIFFALGIPIDIPDKSVAVSFYFEANYGLPYDWNSSYYYEGSYYAKRSLSRQLVYKVFTNKIDR